MFDEDDLPKAKKIAGSGINRNLEPLSLDELAHYITELDAEIARVRTEIARKKDVFGAAESFFK